MTEKIIILKNINWFDIFGKKFYENWQVGENVIFNDHWAQELTTEFPKYSFYINIDHDGIEDSRHFIVWIQYLSYNLSYSTNLFK